LEARNDAGGAIRNLIEFFHDGGVRIFGKLTMGSSIQIPNNTGYTALNSGGTEKNVAVIAGDNNLYIGDSGLVTRVQGDNLTLPPLVNNNALRAMTTGGLARTLAYIDGSNNAVFGSPDLGTWIYGTTVVLPPSTIFSAEGGAEGGQFTLAKAPTGSTLNGDRVAIDTTGNAIRFFEFGSPYRGAYIDIAGCVNGVGAKILTNTTSDFYFQGTAKLLGAGTDLNFIIASGQYTCSFAVNRPTSFSDWGYYEVVQHQDTNWIMQRATDLSNGAQVWFRTKNAGTWSVWRRLSTDGGWKTYSIPVGTWFGATSIDGTSFACLIADADVVANDVIDVDIGYGSTFQSYNSAFNAGVSTYVHSVNGGFHLYSASIPSQALEILYRINK
jgi:hypothetical protein